MKWLLIILFTDPYTEQQSMLGIEQYKTQAECQKHKITTEEFKGMADQGMKLTQVCITDKTFSYTIGYKSLLNK